MASDIDFWILLLRLTLLVLLYGFLALLVYALLRTLRSTRDAHSERAIALGRLAVIESAVPGVVTGQSIELQTATSIGRGAHNLVALNDNFVSASHAILEFRGKGWWISDAGSTNGTFVNRRQIVDAKQLEYGDIIEIGQVKFKLVH